uniref:Uncharacterized protein n=1 Tax=Oryza brachyantha TaxID=4533 RepID=J3LIM0_ORYBR
MSARRRWVTVNPRVEGGAPLLEQQRVGGALGMRPCPQTAPSERARSAGGL